MSVSLTCPVCGEGFSVAPSRAKSAKVIHCSMECYRTATVEWFMRPCDHCGKEYKAYPSRLAKGEGRHCSVKCSQQYRVSHEIKKCPVCGKDVKVVSSKPKTQFCSYSCRGKHLRRENHCQYKPGKVDRNGYPYERDGSHKALVHRTVAEEVLGRELTAEEIVHHMDTDILNNDVDNLMVFPNVSAHIKFHCGTGGPGISLKEVRENGNKQSELERV